MSEKLPRIDCQDLVRVLKRAGFVQDRQRGSHLHLKRPSDNRRVTVPIHKGRIISIGTLAAILRDANIKPDELRELLS